jgi:hypothetical protein
LRHLLLIACAALLAVSGFACKKRERIRVGQTEEGAAGLASIVHVADPRTASQLLGGFHEIEQNSWRWTERAFRVVLKPPPRAAERGAVLTLHFSIAEPLIQKLQTISLTAKAGAKVLPPETYTQAGEFVFTRDLDPSLLAADSLTVEFSLDKFAAAGEFDGRELGLIVTSVGLEPK